MLPLGSYQPKARQPEPEPEPEPEEVQATPAIDIAPLDMDERDRIAAQIEQELTLEGLGLPNYKKGDYGSATGPKMKVVDKGVWSGSTHTTNTVSLVLLSSFFPLNYRRNLGPWKNSRAIAPRRSSDHISLPETTIQAKKCCRSENRRRPMPRQSR